MIEKIISSTRTNFVIGIILILAVIGIIILSTQAYLKSNSDESTINSLQGQLQTLENQLSSTKAQLIILSAQLDDAEGQVASSDTEQDTNITLLQNELTQANNDINTLQNQVNSYISTLSRLQTEVSDDTASISSIEIQLSAIHSYLSSLSNTTTALQSKLASVENTVSSLSNTVKNLVPSATNPVVLFASQNISQAAGIQTLVYTYTPVKSGYISISGYSNSSTVYIKMVNNTTTAFQNYSFGTGTTFSYPVVAGYSYSIILGNTAPSGTVTCVLTAVYYY